MAQESERSSNTTKIETHPSVDQILEGYGQKEVLTQQRLKLYRGHNALHNTLTGSERSSNTTKIETMPKILVCRDMPMGGSVRKKF